MANYILQVLVLILAISSTHQAFVGEKQIQEVDRFFEDGLPKFVDWRNVTHRVTPVKYEGVKCNSSWAFVVAGLLEGQLYNQGLELRSLSSQSLVDCSLKNDGCFGGTIEEGLQFVIEQGGIQDDDSYPYRPLEQKCRIDKNKIVPIKPKGFTYLPAGDVQKLKEVVARYGPVATYMYTDVKFQEAKYFDGIYNEEFCGKDEGLTADHPILIVGYGTDEVVGHYWILKNSWSWFKWGNDGYLRMASKNNQCKLADKAIVALF